MAYRSGPDAGPATRVVLCAACAKPSEITERDESFRCSGCTRTQPTRRTHDDSPGVQTATAFRASGHPELRPFARSMQVTESCAQVTVRCDGVDCEVTLYIDSGGVKGLDLQAYTTGLPSITFTRENDAERKAKASGLTREVQTGDAELDRAVFIESDAADADILAVFSSPAVCAALRSLSADYPTIRFTSRGIELTENRDTARCFDPKRIAEQLAALRVLAGAPRPIAVASEPRSGPARVITKAVVLLLLPIGATLLVGAADVFGPVSVWIGFAGAAAGVVIGLALQPLLRHVLRGRSTSHRELSMTRGGSLLGTPLVTAAIAIAANGALDRAPARSETLPIAAVEWDTEDQKTKATVHDPALGEMSFRFDDARQLSVGDTVTVWTKPGAFGVPWYSQPAVARVRATAREFVE